MRCPHCPVAEGVACDETRNPRRCYLAANNPAYLPVLASLGTGSRPDRGGLAERTQDAPEPHHRPRTNGSPNVHIERLNRAKACPHRGCKTGCSKSECRHFAREVHMSECLTCPVVQDAAADPA